MAIALRAGLANSRIIHARLAVGRGIRYRMGSGGFEPHDGLPTRNGFCDCSGFIAWSIGIDRFQGDKQKPWSNSMPWIETSAIFRDAEGPERLFKEILEPVPGCFAVYPDRRAMGVHFEGHIALVTEVFASGRYTVIDCSSSKGGKTKEAIREWDRSRLFESRGAIFVVLRQDLAA